jgi:hypothetical protein
MFSKFYFRTKLIPALPTLVLMVVLAGCSGESAETKNKIDYSLPQSWAAMPGTQSSATAIPIGSGLSSLEETAKVDVFYIHPTTYLEKNAVNAPIDDPNVVVATDLMLELQAAAFNSVGRIFAPRYRQMSISLFGGSEDALQTPLNIAYEDVRQAFRYYIENKNQGRPFIIAGHSQGANHAQRLLIEEVTGKPCADRLVAAWIPGLALPRSMLNTTAGGGLTACSTSQQIGCVALWETFGEGFTGYAEWVLGQVYWNPGRQRWVSATLNQLLFSVNPMTWDEGTETAQASMNLGAVPFGLTETGVLTETSFQDIYPALISTRNDQGYLMASPTPPVNLFESPTMGVPPDPLIYHVHDFNLFWMNIRDNARQRIHAFLLQRQQVRYPLIESSNTMVGETGRDLSYQIMTINLPQSYEALGLPVGVNINTLTGVISGKPLTQGTFAVVMKATNSYGTDVAELSMRITGSATQ